MHPSPSRPDVYVRRFYSYQGDRDPALRVGEEDGLAYLCPVH